MSIKVSRERKRKYLKYDSFLRATSIWIIRHRSIDYVYSNPFWNNKCQGIVSRMSQLDALSSTRTQSCTISKCHIRLTLAYKSGRIIMLLTASDIKCDNRFKTEACWIDSFDKLVPTWSVERVVVLSILNHRSISCTFSEC